MTAKGVQRWSTDGAALIIEQLRLCSELNSLLEKLAGRDAPCMTVMTCSGTEWPHRGANTITHTVT